MTEGTIPVVDGGAPIRAMLAGAIDYAGLFPPAALDMATAAANYAAYRSSADAWALGRFVLPASRLDELSNVAKSLWSAPVGDDESPWRLSATVGIDAAEDARRIARFNAAHEGAAHVDSVEAAARDAVQVEAILSTFSSLRLFVELPLDADLARLLPLLRRAGASAKVRTGGVVADAIPGAAGVARFIRACADAGVAFKATAGLHHPLRGEYPLTYEAGSARATMFGYLNVFVAAQCARDGASEGALVAVLDARTLPALAARAGGTIAADGSIGPVSAHAMAETRAVFAHSFGSCSFREPLDDLASILQR